MTVLYEVNIKVNRDTFDAYLKWLHPHIDKMLRVKGFHKAILLKELEEKDPAVKGLAVQYFVDSIERLNDYFDHHANAMRAEALLKFEGKFTTNRRILKIDPATFNRPEAKQ